VGLKDQRTVLNAGVPFTSRHKYHIGEKRERLESLGCPFANCSGVSGQGKEEGQFPTQRREGDSKGSTRPEGKPQYRGKVYAREKG